MQHFISVCRLSLAWVTSENSTSNSNADIFWLNLLRWTLSCLLYYLRSPVLTAPVRRSTPTLFAVPPPTPLSSFVQPTLIRVPLPLPDTARFQVQESFVWFRAKTDKGIVCLAGNPYSATYLPQSSNITRASLSDCLVSYTRCSFGERSYP